MSRRFISALEVSVVISLLLTTIACGSGLTRGGNPPPATVAVTVSPMSASVASGGTQQFQATVTGSSNTTVQWEVNQVAGGNSQVGTISSTGLYTAPAATASMTVAVTAVASADTTKSASATVTVSPSTAGITISISAPASTVAVSSTQQFTATVTGTTNTTVNWSVDGVSGGDSSTGTISSMGLYTAPPTAGSHMVVATSAADSTQNASAMIAVISLTLAPQSPSLATTATQQFTATVQGTTNTAVSWSVDGTAGGSSSTGTITSAGLYTAPGAAGSFTVTATSAALASYSVSTTVTVTGNSGPPQGINAIQHIIFVAEENRSFDSYFGKLNEYRAAQGLPTDVDGLPDDCSSTNSDWTVPCSAMNLSPNSQGVPTTPIYAFHLKTMCIENTSPDWIASHWDFNAEAPSSNTPLMDGFVISAASAALASSENDTAGIRAMGFYTGTDLAYFYWLATDFATSDRWFSPAPSRTQVNRYYMVGATSGGQAYPSGIPIHQQTIFDLLTKAGISWKIYSEDGSTSATAFTGFQANGNIVPFDQFITDAQNGTLPQVAYLEKPDADEHPGIGENIQDGVAEVQALVNAVMYGPEWSSSVMIITFDESGGIYDHVPSPTNIPSPDGIAPLDLCTSSSDPDCNVAARTHTAPPYDPTGDFTRFGYRVPLMVVSPFTKAHFVSHTYTDYTSWMKLVETRFGLPNLNARDAYVSDMTEYFDFENVPWATPPPESSVPPINYGQCYDGLP